MNKFAEPLILYAVLFFRFFTGPIHPETSLEFSANAEVARIVLHTGPALALVWYLMLRVKSLKEWGVTLPGKGDIIPAAIGLPAIVLAGFGITIAARHFGGLPEVPRILPPTTVVPWAILVVSVFVAAYLEESFFRFYLLARRDDANGSTGYGPMELDPHRAVLVSTLLFAFCHIYAGFWGFLNAAISGAVLAYIFLKYRSLHGVSFAHGLYNVLVFAIGPA